MEGSNYLGKRTQTTTIICLILFIVTVSLFSFYGYQWIQYLLGTYFDVPTNAFSDLITGIIGMIASIIVFIGAINLWQMKHSSVKLLVYGSIGFLIKNALDLINDFKPLRGLDVVQSWDITSVAWSLGIDLFHIGFWIFILVFITRHSVKEQLS